jgi:hypothetical protein
MPIITLCPQYIQSISDRLQLLKTARTITPIFASRRVKVVLLMRDKRLRMIPGFPGVEFITFS